MDIKWVEYQNMVNYLSQWIKHHVAVMSDRTFPSNPAELKVGAFTCFHWLINDSAGLKGEFGAVPVKSAEASI